MKTRTWKRLALLATAGILLQLGGCAQFLVDSLISNILPILIARILEGALQQNAA